MSQTTMTSRNDNRGESMETQDISARNKLITANIDRARKIARGVSFRVPRSVAREDLESAAFLGLAEAANRFDPKQADKFTAFASKWIRGSILDELRRRDVLSRGQRRQVREQEKARTRCDSDALLEAGPANDNCRPLRPSNDNAAQIQIPVLTAFDDSYHVASNEPEFPSVEARLDDSRRAQHINSAIVALPAREREVLSMYYKQSLNLKQIGRKLSVSESRVCQIRGRAEQRLKTICAQAA